MTIQASPTESFEHSIPLNTNDNSASEALNGVREQTYSSIAFQGDNQMVKGGCGLPDLEITDGGEDGKQGGPKCVELEQIEGANPHHENHGSSNDHIRDLVVDGLDPKAREQYKYEQEALEQYRQAKEDWLSIENNTEPKPDMPDKPVTNYVEGRVRDLMRLRKREANVPKEKPTKKTG